MKKMKKVMGLLLVFVLMISSMTGCKSTSGEKNKAVANNSATDESKNSANATTEVAYNIVMVYPTVGQTPADLQKVQDELNKITLAKINCTVEFKPIPVWELTSQYNLWASSGEKVDLLCLYGMNVYDYVASGKILALDDYMADATAINKTDKDYPFLANGVLDGHQYTIPIINSSAGVSGSLSIRTDILDATGYDKTKDIYTYEDLDAIFAKVKELYPDLYAFGKSGAMSATQASQFLTYEDFGLGGTAGVLLNPNTDNKIVNLFETEQYKDYLNWMSKWYKDGYISPDAATTSQSGGDLVKAGQFASTGITQDNPGMLEWVTSNTGYDITFLPVRSNFLSGSPATTGGWAISANCEQPEKVLQFLNLWFDGNEVTNLIQNGIEGDHYVKTDVDKVITYPKDVDGATTPYNNILGLYGDRRNVFQFNVASDYFAKCNEYTQKSFANKSIAYGYAFNSSELTTETTALTNVMAQYLSSLEYGMADVDEMLPQFQQALKDAGIEKVIAENQKQFDVWLQSNGTK